MKPPQEVKLSREKGEAFIERLPVDALTVEDRRVLVQVLRVYFWLLFALQEAMFAPIQHWAVGPAAVGDGAGCDPT